MKLVAKTFQGLEGVLEKEIKGLGYEETSLIKRGVIFQGDKEAIYAANLHLRTALRVLWEIKTFTAESEDELYRFVRAIPWEDHLDLRSSFAVDAVVHSTTFRHSKFCALRVKDAIADRFTSKFGRRPDVDRDFPDVQVHLHISGHECAISLDSSGKPLHQRGYSAKEMDLPVFNEVLAAGMVLLSGWNGEGNFIDPMCGSGTILAEAGMFARKIAPGSIRKEFGFMRWRNFDPALWKRLLADAKAEEIRGEFKLIGGDASPKSLTATRKTLLAAGLGARFSLENYEFQHFRVPTGTGIIMADLPTLEGKLESDVQEFYSMVGSNLKWKGTGYHAWLLSGSKEGLKAIGLRSEEKIELWNGKMECRFVHFPLFG